MRPTGNSARCDRNRRRSCAASEPIDRDAKLAGLVGEIVLNAGAGEDDDADRQDAQHLIGTLKQCGLGMLRPVGLEGDLRYPQEAEEPPPLLHPNMAHHYHVQVDELYAALQEDAEARRVVAADVLRSLVREIILTPEDGELQIDVRGNLVGILAVSLKSKRPA